MWRTPTWVIGAVASTLPAGRELRRTPLSTHYGENTVHKTALGKVYAECAYNKELGVHHILHRAIPIYKPNYRASASRPKPYGSNAAAVDTSVARPPSSAPFDRPSRVSSDCSD